MGAVFVPFSVHDNRTHASPLAGLVNVALNGFAPLFNCTGLVSGNPPPLPLPSRMATPLISTFRLPFSSAWKLKLPRRSAFTAPTHVAVNAPPGRKGV